MVFKYTWICAQHLGTYLYYYCLIFIKKLLLNSVKHKYVIINYYYIAEVWYNIIICDILLWIP